MEKEFIIAAYDAAAPDEVTRQRILNKITPNLCPRSHPRKILIAAAAVALMAALATGTYAAYKAWTLPAPTPYDGSNGNYQIQTEATYSEKNLPTDPEPLSDAHFINSAVEILKSVGLDDVESEQLRVVRQENLPYSRSEAKVCFENSTPKTTVCFNADSGQLLSLTGIEWVEEGTQTTQAPEELAQYYYETLPVPQGYVLAGCEVYDEQYHSYSFCRQVDEDLYNYYEMVRIAVNPVNGRLQGCNVFYMPLLDDHQEGDQPLTCEEAETIARNLDALNLTDFDLESAEVTVVLPNWAFTEHMDTDLQYSQVTRLAWTLVFNHPDSEFADSVTLNIDYYTGQLLGGDVTS